MDECKCKNKSILFLWKFKLSDVWRCKEHLIAKEIALLVDAAERSRENWKKKKSKVSALGFLLFCFAWCSILVRIKPWTLEPSLPEVKPASPTRQLGCFGPASSSVKQGWKGSPISLGCYVAAMTLTAQSKAIRHRLMAESSHFRHQPQTWAASLLSSWLKMESFSLSSLITHWNDSQNPGECYPYDCGFITSQRKDTH